MKGVFPALDCKNGVLNGVSWYYNLKGSVIDGACVLIGKLEKENNLTA
jgi:ribonuclease T2